MGGSESALVVGVGSGLSAALARLFAKEGMNVALAARNPGKLTALAQETNARVYACDAGEPDQVERLFAAVESDVSVPDLVVYNPSYRCRGPLVELDPAEVATNYKKLNRSREFNCRL